MSNRSGTRLPSAAKPIVSACGANTLLEQWRERLVADEAAAWTELGGRITDRQLLQQMRALARQARAEQAAAKPPAASRQLFRELREALAGVEM